MTGPHHRVGGRRSIRLPYYDYSQEGAYFVTVCAHNRGCLFGEVEGEEVALNDAGRIVKREWMRTVAIRPDVELDEFVVMPNHVHGIVLILQRTGPRHTWAPRNGAAFGSPSRALGSIIRGFKGTSASRINEMRGSERAPVWQRGYYERVVRDEQELNLIRGYIAGNPAQWSVDRENEERVGEAKIYQWLYPRRPVRFQGRG